MQRIREGGVMLPTREKKDEDQNDAMIRCFPDERKQMWKDQQTPSCLFSGKERPLTDLPAREDDARTQASTHSMSSTCVCWSAGLRPPLLPEAIPITISVSLSIFSSFCNLKPEGFTAWRIPSTATTFRHKYGRDVFFGVETMA